MSKVKEYYDDRRELFKFAVTCLLAIITGISLIFGFTMVSITKDQTSVIQAKNAEIELLNEQKERLSNNAAYCIEFEQKLSEHCTCDFMDEAAQGK